MTDRILEYVSKKTGFVPPQRLSGLLALERPSFINSEYIEPAIAEAWKDLPREARLVAFLLAHERAALDTHNGELDG